MSTMAYMERYLSKFLLIDMTFFRKVYSLVSKIPPGKVTTYGLIAKKIGTKDARKVGFALHANKSSSIPCHRVVNVRGELAKNFAFSGENEQRARLMAEGVLFLDDHRVDMKKCAIMDI